MTRRKRIPANKSLASRITNLEDAIDELKEALVPTEFKAIFWAPGLPEPDMENLPKGHTVIRFVSEAEIKEPDPNARLKLREEIEARAAKRKAEREAETQAEEQAHQIPTAAEAATARKQDTVIEVAQGVRWGFQPSLRERHKNYDTRPDWYRLNRSGIF